MRTMRNRVAVALVGIAVVVLVAPWRSSQAAPTAKDMERIEAAIRNVAVEGPPRTVCVRVTMKDGHQGYGSGAIVSADGLVLTCAHVTEPARGGSLTAILVDGTEMPLRVVASNAHNDYALCRLRTQRTDFPYFPLAKAEPALGDWVVALGHPGGPFADHQPTVAAGKVTGKDRDLPMMLDGKEYVGALQTDVPLYGGNSGGPLVDLDCHLVGINGAMLAVGDVAFATSAVRISRHLPELRRGHDVSGEAIEDVFSSMQALANDVDPDALADAVADEGFKSILKAVSSMGSLGGTPKPRAPRRLDDLKQAFHDSLLVAPGALFTRADGSPVGRACVTFVGRRSGRALFVTTGRAGRLEGTLRLVYRDRWGTTGSSPSLQFDAEPRVRAVDGEWDLALLDLPSDGPDIPLPSVAPPADVAAGEFVLLPDVVPMIRQAGVISAVDRAVGTDRKVPTLGLVRLFQPPHTSPFRPYPKMIQIDCPLEADEMGGPVVRPDGSLVGIAVAHFCGGVTMVVPASVLAERVELMLKGIDSPAPKTYGPPPRPAPDRARIAARALARTKAADALTLYVPTLAGVPKPVRLFAPDAGGAGPTVSEDSGAGPLDLHAGDALVSVDGKPTRDTESARAAIAAADGPLVVVVRRGEADLRFDAVVTGAPGARRLSLTGTK